MANWRFDLLKLKDEVRLRRNHRAGRINTLHSLYPLPPLLPVVHPMEESKGSMEVSHQEAEGNMRPVGKHDPEG